MVWFRVGGYGRGKTGEMWRRADEDMVTPEETGKDLREPVNHGGRRHGFCVIISGAQGPRVVSRPCFLYSDSPTTYVLETSSRRILEGFLILERVRRWGRGSGRVSFSSRGSDSAVCFRNSRSGGQ